jgi:hypothetical protein
VFSLAIALILFLGSFQPVQASDITVTSSSDVLDAAESCSAVTITSLPGPDGVTSLREAVCVANQTRGSDIITFDAATDGIPIVLTGPAGEDANDTGDLDILYAGDLTILGSGAANTIIDGGGIDRVFHICPGGVCSNTVTITGVTIRNGSADFGGGILNQGGTLNLQDSTIGGANAGNTASDEGGGIENQAGTLTLDGTTVTNNTAEYGGGICNHAALNIQNGSTIGVVGLSNTAHNGGGIHNYAGSTIVKASTVISNTASSDGGGIYNYAGSTTVENSTIISNTASDDGGGIHIQDGSTTVETSTVSANNAADSGGGIYNHAALTVTDSTIGKEGGSNEAYYGGGIHNFSGQVTVSGSKITANKAFEGGGIYNHYSATLYVDKGSTIGGTGAGNTATYHGGGIFNGIGGTTTVDASTISANTAVRGGGIYSDATPVVQTSSTTGGIQATVPNTILAPAVLTVQNGSTIGGAGAGNTATVNGGGIYIGTDSTTTVKGSTVISNTAGSGGGGIFNWFGTTTVEDSTVISNAAVANGGGINNYLGTTTVDGCTISSNSAPQGGGIYNHATLIVNNSTIGGAGAGNTAVAGGGIHNWFGAATVDSSTISANTASHGGGIYNDAVSTAATANGGSLATATLSIQNSTIGGVGAGNTATTAGGGIYNGYEFTMQVVGSRILYNTAPNGGGVFSWNEFVGATSVTDSCIVGNSQYSFFNDKAAQQTATGDWWGAVGGPGAPGADTVGGNVDTSGFLNTPILGCAPDLLVDKTNNTGEVGVLGTPFNWTLTVTNSGLMEAVFYAGQRILEDDLPAGPTYGSPVVGNLVDVTNSANITCSIASGTLTCEATGANVTIAAATGRFDVVLPVTPNASGALSNPDGNCLVDPDGMVTESDEGNNNCPANTVIVREPWVYLPLVLRGSP